MTRTRAFAVFCFAIGLSIPACSSDGHGASADAPEVALPVTGTLAYRGVSLAGAEFGVDAYGSGPLPGAFGVNYMYPDSKYAAGYASPDYFVSKGMTVFRLPFRWERLQPARNAAFDAAELTRLSTTVSDLTAKGVTVILDPHNYARYGTALIGSQAVPNADFADLWSRLATAFKGNKSVLFGLMNEPHDMPTEQWVKAANAAIAAIRATGATQTILVPGNGWTGASSWSQSWYGTPNATAMLGIQDPGNNFAYEAHQYFDPDGSGTNTACVSTTIGAERLKPFTDWLHANGKKGFLGEFGASTDPTCLSAIDGALTHLEQNADVYLGWTYWAGGPWWGVNWMAIEPVAGKDTGQMTTLLPHLAAPVTPPVGTQSPPSQPPPSQPSQLPTVTCQGSTYDAATMTHSTGGAALGGGWCVWSDGYVQTPVNLGTGATSITVNARGTSAGGVAPHMAVAVDGVTIGSASVTAASWTPYSFAMPPKSGVHQVRVSFDNDAIVGSEDRNLFVKNVVVGCGAVLPTPAPKPIIPPSITVSKPPTGGTCTPQTVAASTMTHSVGAALTDGWNLWGNGYASTTVTLAAGSNTLTVNAKGTPAGGVSPHMVVSLDGASIGSTSVSATAWTGYSFPFTATAGAHELRVAFDNDAVMGSEDRNLFLQSLTLSCGSTGSAPPPACVPTTCASEGKSCGTISDGCNGTLACGSCTSPDTCGGGGVANVCGAPTAPPQDPPPQQPPPQDPPPAGSAIRIMPLGDSITLGVNGGYRNGLWTRLAAAGKTIDYVGSQSDQYAKAPDHDHEGHPGFTIGNIASNADGWVKSAAPTHVLLMIGTNDVAWWCAQSASQVADTDAALIDQLLADLPGAWIVVASIPPLTSSVIQPNGVDRAALAKEYNAQLVARVQARIQAGKKVRFADVASVLTTADLYDGVHPTEAAHDKVAQVWFDALTPILP